MFDPITGNATTERCVRDYEKVTTAKTTYKTPCNGKSFKWQAANPAINWLQTGKLATEKGTPFETTDGMPCGTFAKLEIGTKVIVAKVNNGSMRCCACKAAMV